MDKDKLNDAISVLKELCEKYTKTTLDGQNTCSLECPILGMCCCCRMSDWNVLK